MSKEKTKVSLEIGQPVKKLPITRKSENSAEYDKILKSLSTKEKGIYPVIVKTGKVNNVYLSLLYKIKREYYGILGAHKVKENGIEKIFVTKK